MNEKQKRYEDLIKMINCNCTPKVTFELDGKPESYCVALAANKILLDVIEKLEKKIKEGESYNGNGT